jgi:hypothetical protein
VYGQKIHPHPQKSMAGSDLRSLLFHWHAISSDLESAKRQLWLIAHRLVWKALTDVAAAAK